jgi:hypothetical protein
LALEGAFDMVAGPARWPRRRVATIAPLTARRVRARAAGPPCLGTKEQLRRQFGVAATTFNEAIRLLERRGRLLERRGVVEARPGPRGGIVVAGPSARVRRRANAPAPWGSARVDDYPVIRNAVEPLVIRDAALHHDPAEVRGPVSRRRSPGCA